MPAGPSHEDAEAAATALLHEAELPPPARAVEGAELAPIEIVWEGIGALHKSYFSEQEGVTALSVALAPYLQGTVQLKVFFDQENHLGKIRILIPPGALRSVPQGQPADLQALAPLTVALARYRDHVGNSFDLRVLSFHIGLDFFRGPVHCGLEVAGDPPPDGRIISPCVLINGVEQCGTPGPQGTRFEGAAAEQVERCLTR